MASNPPRKQHTKTVRDCYTNYVKWMKGKDEDPLPYKEYKKVMSDFFVTMMSKVIHENYTFILPQRMGNIKIITYKFSSKTKVIDWGESKRKGEKVYYITPHTFGHYFKTTWVSHRLIKNKKYYKYKMPKSNRAYRLGISARDLRDKIMDAANNPLKRSFLK